MDPTTWPMWLKLMAGWGPLGLWAARAEWRAWKAEKEHHKTRDLHTKEVLRITELARKETESHAESEAKIRDEHALQMAQLRDEQAKQIAELRDEHEHLLRQLANRMFTLVQRQSKETRALADKVDEKKHKE